MKTITKIGVGDTVSLAKRGTKFQIKDEVAEVLNETEIILCSIPTIVFNIVNYDVNVLSKATKETKRFCVLIYVDKTGWKADLKYNSYLEKIFKNMEPLGFTGYYDEFISDELYEELEIPGFYIVSGEFCFDENKYIKEMKSDWKLDEFKGTTEELLELNLDEY